MSLLTEYLIFSHGFAWSVRSPFLVCNVQQKSPARTELASDGTGSSPL